MTLIVPLVPGTASTVASGPEYGVKYALIAADGSRCVFNDPSDADYVGMLSNISGLDSPDVREAADDLVGDDGGIHGNFLYGRRPIVIEGQIDNTPAAQHSELFVPATPTYINLVTNPSAQIDSSGYGATNATMTRFLSGSTWIIRGTATTTTGSIGPYWGGRAPVASGVTYTASVEIDAISSVNGSQQVRCSIDWFDASNAYISSANGTASRPGSFPARLSVTGAPPINAVSANVTVTFATTAPSVGDYIDTSHYMLTATNFMTSYFTGNSQTTISGEGMGYTSWNGPQHASTSNYFVVQKRVFDPGRVRNLRMTALQRVTNAMRSNSQLHWTPEGGVEQVVYLRRQQPLRIAGNYNKTFQAAMASADPRIYAAAINELRVSSPATPTPLTNNGTVATPPVVTLYGPTSGTMTNIEVRNTTNGNKIVLATGYGLGPGQYIVFDMANKTALRENGTNLYDQINFATSNYWSLDPGVTNVSFVGIGTTGASMVVRWQDAWI